MQKHLTLSAIHQPWFFPFDVVLIKCVCAVVLVLSFGSQCIDLCISYVFIKQVFRPPGPYIDKIIDRFLFITWEIMAFLTLFQLYHNNQCTYPCYLEISFSYPSDSLLPKPLAAFPHNNHREMTSKDRGMSILSEYSILGKTIG